MADLPDRYAPEWSALVDEANRRRVAVEVRLAPDTTTEDDGTTLRGTFRLLLRNRGGSEPRVIGTVGSFDQAIAKLRIAIEAEPLPGSDQLREELRAFGRRLAMLTPRDVAKKSGADVPIYRVFRDRILPLAWDNLVDSIRVDVLEDFVRRVGRMVDDGVPDTVVAELAAEARGLVAPLEERPVVPELEAAIDKAKPKPRRRRKATDGDS